MRALIALVVSAAAAPALAQDAFPAQPIEIIVPFGAGGGADSMAHKVAALLERPLGVRLPITHVPGASGNAGLTKLLTNPPDGYTMAVLISPTVSAWAAGIGYAKPDDFAMLAVTQQSASMLFVPADSAFRSFASLLEYAKAHPGRLRVATSGYGSTDDITLKYFDSFGYRMTNVPFAKPEQRYAASFSRRTQALYEEPGDVAALLASRKLRPLVVFDTHRHSAFEDVPSSAELGYQINDLPTFRTLVVRAGTAAERQKILVDAIGKALATSEWKTFCAQSHSCAPPSTQQDAAERVRLFLETSRKYLRQFQPARPPG
jgi:tripartite-type tricarboxylate transporter receptor subunit TctC